MTVAEWSNKVPALVVNLPTGRRKARVVVFNGRPGSAEVSAHGWTGKGQRLIYNMVRYATAFKTESKCLI